MAKSQTDKSRLPSKYSNGFVSQAQFLTECMCEIIAKHQRKKLPFKFWDLPEWNKTYRRHITEAYKLLKKYSFETILTTLNDSHIKTRCNSFCYPPLIKLLTRNAKLIRKYPNSIPTIQTSEVNTDASCRIPLQSPLNKLRNL